LTFAIFSVIPLKSAPWSLSVVNVVDVVIEPK
jgi:hypothetical protein